MNLQTTFGGYVRRLRKGQFLTQEELAASSGISTDGLRRIERGVTSPRLDTIAKLARALGLSLTMMFAGHEADPTLPGVRDLIAVLGRLTEPQRRKALSWMQQEFGRR